jgi:general secretion pathway protein A
VAVVGGSAWIGWLVLGAADQEIAASRPAWQAVLDDATMISAWSEAAVSWPGLDREDIAQACASPGTVVGGVACLALRGNWSYISRINLPVIVRLTADSTGVAPHVLLVGMEGEQLLLRHAGQDVRAPIRQIDRRWLGDFYVIWPDSGQILRRGDRSEAVAQLKRLASLLDTEPWTGPLNEGFDQEFEAWIERFQRRNGLRDDGMIGPATRLFLKAPHVEGPSLALAQQGD